MERQRLKLSLNRRTNPRMAGENGEGRPMVGSFSNGISGCSFRASASTSFSETKSSTSCPRSRNTSATASPGKRCPPVPPHAITAFIKLFGGTRVRASRTRRSVSLRILLRRSNPGSHSYPRRHARLHGDALRISRFQFGLPVNTQQNTDAKEAGCEIRASVTDKRERQPFVWQKRSRHSDVHRRLQRQQRNNPAAEEHAKTIFGVEGDHHSANNDDNKQEHDDQA